MSDDARYLILRPQGQEGPFTRDDLARLAEAGRLHADERILDAATRAPTTAGELLPGITRADAQARVRRRSTSDRLPAQSVAPRPRGGRTPLPAAAAPPSSDEAPPPSPPAVRPPPARWAVVLVAAAAVFLLAAAVRLAAQALAPPPERLLPTGTWSARAPGGAWRLEISGDGIVVVAPDGSRHATAYVRVASDEARCVVELASPHPRLGRRLVLTADAVRCDLGELPAEHLPPL